MKNINLTTIRFLFFKKDADVEKVLASKKISFGEKNYKYFITQQTFVGLQDVFKASSA